MLSQVCCKLCMALFSFTASTTLTMHKHFLKPLENSMLAWKRNTLPPRAQLLCTEEEHEPSHTFQTSAMMLTPTCIYSSSLCLSCTLGIDLLRAWESLFSCLSFGQELLTPQVTAFQQASRGLQLGFPLPYTGKRKKAVLKQDLRHICCFTFSPWQDFCSNYTRVNYKAPLCLRVTLSIALFFYCLLIWLQQPHLNCCWLC